MRIGYLSLPRFAHIENLYLQVKSEKWLSERLARAPKWLFTTFHLFSLNTLSEKFGCRAVGAQHSLLQEYRLTKGGHFV